MSSSSSSSEATPPSSSSSTDSSEPPPSPPSTSPPPESTPPPSPPAANPPPSQPPPSPPTSPPPSPPTSSPPPPASTPPASPPPSTPAASESPPPPASSASPPPPVQSPPSPSATPSTPPPAEEAAPVQNPPPQPAADSPPLPTNSPPQPKPSSAETPPTPPTLSSHPPRSASASRPSDSLPSDSSSEDQPSINGGVIAGIVVGGVVIILLLIVIICLMCTKRRRKSDYYQPNGANQYYNQDPSQWHGQQPMDPNMKLHPPAGSFMGWHANTSGEFSSGYSGQHPVMGMPPSASQNMGGMYHFSYEELAAATNGFSEANLLGQGGFGLVHKGVLPDRREVAVKSLKSGSGQGEREFQAEVEIISRVHHRHLVSLVGYCIANDNKLLVYEFVPNKTLEFHLHGKGQPVIDWPTRLRIAVGSAKGLAYLHEDCLPRIIHRDIKAANILIDNNYEAMVADFGLAKLTTDNHTHVSTRVMGTFGYLAPEYASSGKLSEKSDVFSFGVMLLELITGRRPIDLSNMMEDSLVDWARPLLSKAQEDGNYEELVDPRLEGKFVHHELSRMAACAAASIRHSARKRPKMSQIVRALEGDSSLDDLNEGVKPGQSAVYNPNGGTEVYDTRAYNADMMKFKKMVMASQEFNSSDYGLNPSVSTTDTDSREMDNSSIHVKKN